MDNGGRASDCFGRTYFGVDGHCNLAADLGSLGDCREPAAPPGTQHFVKAYEVGL